MKNEMLRISELRLGIYLLFANAYAKITAASMASLFTVLLEYFVYV